MTTVIAWLLALCLAVAAFLLGFGGSPAEADGGGDSPALGLRRDVNEALRDAGLRLSPRGFLGVSAATASVGTVLGWLLAPALLPAVMMSGFIAGGAPSLWVMRTGVTRRRRFEEQLLPTIVQLSEAVGSGRSLTGALVTVASSARPPMSRELKRVVDDLSHDVPLETALRDMRDRVRSDDVAFFAAAVVLQRESGGSLAEVLDRIAETLRERFRLRDLVRSLTAQGRLTGTILGMLPVGIGIYMYWMVPDHIQRLWTFAGEGSLLNYLPLTLALVAELVGFLWIRKIVTIDY